ncbi:hypothetical protein ASPVEDRAFT_871843 [Aspergillus versicolor CBS 583.65]|uniref:Uncharacterized protein n=1 Tax=Aspergillus versicolor CBS 583.65 TaxID=1036611 RepID=A0A1L9P3S5_ASPVE|nr:uncharacterized protein ASPVEDRAFT_871843 [Aspergillus versicolor CBS 583.65]OJI96162.1 hypothetical protein ASPVEDRAFT_871843 [Aspergillus versicolor CBS 583.65]
MWKGILFKLLDENTGFPEQFFTPTPYRIDTENKIVGNMEGISLLEMLETIKSDFRQLKNIADTIRTSTLDEWAGINSDRPDRNGLVHGGDILGDISIISRMDTAGTKETQIWKEVFRKNYGVSFSTCTNSNRIRQADDRLIEIFNIYANTNVLHRWERPEVTDTVKKIQSCCWKILEAWSTKGSDIFEDPSILDNYKTAATLHHS